MDLKGKVGIVTGAGRGLGWAIAERLAHDGATLVIAEIDPKSGKEKADVVGRIDILVNNAGLMGNYYPVTDYPEEEWDRLIDVNLKGMFLCCKAVLPVMIRQKYGKIVSLASVAGKEGNARMPAYSASKAAVMALTKTIAKEVAASNINVNCVSPALCETDMAKDMTAEQRALLISKIPMGRLGKPEEVAAVVKFLASDESSFVTGQCYDISGGRSDY
ncbi:MAG: 3-oxoacyl-ACP reductase [Deltaproteobacteria bacterium]|nr:3-oxoacyl-ACP reductase [Deltaproteobacteria bacterium]